LMPGRFNCFPLGRRQVNYFEKNNIYFLVNGLAH
jgi:hypothetical protein